MTIFYLANIDPHSGIGESLGFMLVGFAMVVLVLSLLYLLCATVGKFFLPKKKPAEPKHIQPVSASPAKAQASTGPDPRLIAAIAAAVETVLGHAVHEIVSIKPAGKGYNAWAQEGRRQIFQSHKIR